MTGVPEKLRDTDNLFKFDSAVSELEIARLFAEQGKVVSLLSDDAWMRSPDLVVNCAGLEVYVEVKRITDDGAAGSIMSALREFLPTLSTPVRVDVLLKDGLVSPVTTLEERNKKDEHANESLRAFKAKLSTQDLGTLPVTIDTPAADFTLHRTARSSGFPGVFTWPTFPIPESILIRKMINDVELKSSKRDSWRGERHNHPYVIALVSENPWIDYVMIKTAFLGEATEVYGTWPNPSPVPQVTAAAQLGWGQFLSEECLLPNRESRCYLPRGKEGAFLTRAAMSNVSAVLVRVITGRYYLIPNPFASQEINAPTLCRLLSPRISGY